MVGIYNEAKARADRPHLDRLHDVFARAVKPQIQAEIAKTPQPGIGERVWGAVVSVALSAVYMADRLRAGVPQETSTVKMSFEDEMSWSYANNLIGGWLRGLRLTKDDTGAVCESAVFPGGDPGLSERWAETQMCVKHHGKIDMKEVLKRGLEELAVTPGDVTLPLGMTLKRPVLDAALARARSHQGPQM